jgi:hypothetical protein
LRGHSESSFYSSKCWSCFGLALSYLVSSYSCLLKNTIPCLLIGLSNGSASMCLIWHNPIFPKPQPSQQVLMSLVTTTNYFSIALQLYLQFSCYFEFNPPSLQTNLIFLITFSLLPNSPSYLTILSFLLVFYSFVVHHCNLNMLII